MAYVFQKMTKNHADEICFRWKYSGIYSFYNMTEDVEDLNEFLDPASWNHIYSVLETDELIGFYQYEKKEGFLFIGFGLRPDLTGKGLGENFVLSGMKFLSAELGIKPEMIRLSVASFNKRAVQLYSKIGFALVDEFVQKTNGGEYPFITMQFRS